MIKTLILLDVGCGLLGFFMKPLGAWCLGPLAVSFVLLFIILGLWLQAWCDYEEARQKKKVEYQAARRDASSGMCDPGQEEGVKEEIFPATGRY